MMTCASEYQRTKFLPLLPLDAFNFQWKDFYKYSFKKEFSNIKESNSTRHKYDLSLLRILKLLLRVREKEIRKRGGLLEFIISYFIRCSFMITQIDFWINSIQLNFVNAKKLLWRNISS